MTKKDPSYGFESMCGLPAVTLEGTLEDWIKVREKAMVY